MVMVNDMSSFSRQAKLGYEEEEGREREKGKSEGKR